MKVDGDKLTKNMTDNLKKIDGIVFFVRILQMVILMYW
jgi:hypothetical protein